MAHLRSVSEAIDSRQQLFVLQLVSIGYLIAGAIGVWLIEWYSPTFFNYPYFYWGGWGAVGRFWPLFVWGIALTLALEYLDGDVYTVYGSQDRELLGWSLVTSTLAGLWEEPGYRCIFICYAMISLVFFDWVYAHWWGLLFGWVSVLIGIVVAIALLLAKEPKPFAAVRLGVLTLCTAWSLFHTNPVSWFYEHLTVPAVNFVTFYQLENMLQSADKIFIFGAICANFWFKDGHKYQGPVGLVNSWYAGMILLYATVTYGLLTAIVVHAAYNIGISVLRFVLLQRGKW